MGEVLNSLASANQLTSFGRRCLPSECVHHQRWQPASQCDRAHQSDLRVGADRQRRQHSLQPAGQRGSVAGERSSQPDHAGQESRDTFLTLHGLSLDLRGVFLFIYCTRFSCTVQIDAFLDSSAKTLKQRRYRQRKRTSYRTVCFSTVCEKLSKQGALYGIL